MFCATDSLRLQALKEELDVLQSQQATQVQDDAFQQRSQQLESELTSLRQQLTERDGAIAEKDGQLTEMSGKLEASHSDVRETASRLSELQVQLQRMGSTDAKLHSLQQELEHKNSAMHVSDRTPPTRGHVVVINPMYCVCKSLYVVVEKSVIFIYF